MIYSDEWRKGQHCPRKIDGVPKSKLRRRSASSVSLVCVHASAVRGGFGVGKQLRAKVRVLLGAAATEEDVSRTAVLIRYVGETYHGIYRPGDSMLPALSAVQWPVTDWTYHGDHTNGRSVGWAIDGLWRPDHQDDLGIEEARTALRHFIDAALEQGAPLTEITAHANHSRKPHDPDRLVWCEVVRPVAAEYDLTIRPEWTTGHGSAAIHGWESILGWDSVKAEAPEVCEVAS